MKYSGGEIALYAELIEFHTFGILLSVTLFGKKDSGRLFWSYLLFTGSFENKFMSGRGAK